MVEELLTFAIMQEWKSIFTMDQITHIINGMDIEGLLNGGVAPVIVDGKFTGEIHAETVTLNEHAMFSGKLFATHVEIGGQFNGELICDTLNVTTPPNL